jgi:integrase
MLRIALDRKTLDSGGVRQKRDTANMLTYVQLKARLRRPGRYLVDSGGLYFRVLPGEKGYWAYRYQLRGRVREMSLGPFPKFSLAEARAKHAEVRQRVRKDKADPLAIPRARTATDSTGGAGAPTFGEVADRLLRAKSGEWRSHVHIAQWRRTLTRDCAPIRSMPVDQVDTETVLRVLRPLWERAPETASRCRNRIELVLNAARARGWIDENRANPARWRGHLENWLSNPKKVGDRKHFAAMPYADVPAFFAKLKDKPALAFAILTAARSGEALGATWDEIDLDAAVWTVPGNRQKTGKNHRVPLSSAAIAIVREQHQSRGDNPYLFPGNRPRRPMGKDALFKTMRQVGSGGYTVHGFRSSLRDWAGDETHFAREVAEVALSHKVGDQTEAAYRRSDALEKRRELMEAWARYLDGAAIASKVLTLNGKGNYRPK